MQRLRQRAARTRPSALPHRRSRSRPRLGGAAIDENIPEELEQLIMKLMNKLPEDRHQTCAELASELRSLKKQFAT